MGDETARACSATPEPSRSTKTSSCRATAPTGFVCAFFATFMGFALIWHIWWLALVAFVGAFATFVVFAWRDRTEYRIPADGGRPHRPGQPCRPPRGIRPDAARRMSIAARTRASARRRGERRARRSVPHRDLRACAEAHHRRLRLLDLPAQRHHHVLRVLRHLRGPGGRDRRRPERQGPVPSRHRRDRDGLPAAVELHLRRRQHRRARASRRHVLWRAWR